MADINVSELVPGMKTQAPVEVQGRMLVGAGAEITDKMIAMFKTWGVARVSVEGGGAAQSGGAGAADGLGPEDRQRVEAAVAARFSRLAEPDAVMLEIRRIAVKMETARVLSGGRSSGAERS